MHYKYGNKWSRMARHLPGRTDNEIKNFWHSRVKKCKKQSLPIYPEWCQEEDDGWTDDEVDDFDVAERPKTNPPSFTANSLPEVQHFSAAPYSHDQESLEYYSNHQPNSSLSSNDHFSFTQQAIPAFQTFENPNSEFNSYQQPHISFQEFSQHQQSSTFHSAENSLSASIPSSEMQYLLHGQSYIYGPHYLSSSDQQSHLNHSLQAPAPQIELPSETRFQSTHKFHLSRPNPLTSNAFVPQLNQCSSGKQLGPISNSNFAVSNSNYNGFKRFRATPILSPPCGRFKQVHKPTGQLPPVPKPTQLSFPEQGQSLSGSIASNSSEVKSPTSTSPRSSFKRNSSTNEPTSSSFKLNISKMRSSASCPDTDKLLSCFQLNPSAESTSQSFLNLKASAPMAPDSHGQTNSSTTTSSGPSLKRNLSSSGMPTSSDPSLKRTLPSSGMPISSLPLNSSQAPGYSSIFKSKLPSIQLSRRDLKPNPEMNQNFREKSKRYSDLIDASVMQEALAESSLSDLHLVKGYLLSKQLKTKHLYGNMLARRMSQNISSNKGIMMGESPWREGSSSGGSMELSDQRRTREVMMSKRPDTQDFTGNYSYRKLMNFSSGSNFGSYVKDFGRSGEIPPRKQDLSRNITEDEDGLQCEVSKTGVLLVENTRKEILLSKLLKRQNSMSLSSQQEGSLRDGSLPQDVMVIENLENEKLFSENFLRESLKRKCPLTESVEKESSTITCSMRDRNLTPLSKSDGSSGNLQSSQIPPSDFLDSMSESSKKICLRNENLTEISFGESSNFEGPLTIHGQDYVKDAPGTTPLTFGNSFGESTYFQPSEGQSLGRKCPESLQIECIEDQTLVNSFLDETLKGEGLDSQDKQYGLCESSLLTFQYTSPDLINSSPPIVELSSSQTSKSKSLDKCVKTEDSLNKNLEKSNTCDENLKKEPVFASIELTPPQIGVIDPVTSQSTAADKPKHSGSCSAEKELQQEPKELQVNPVAEEFSSIFGCFPTTPRVPKMNYSDDQLDIFPGSDTPLLSPTFLFA